MLILGKDDKMTPAKKAKPIADAIEKVDTRIIDQCGHMMMIERPNAVYDAMSGFVWSTGPDLLQLTA